MWRNPLARLFRGETAFDFTGRWKLWFAISGLVILVGGISLGVRGLNFSIDFKGGTVWQVPSSASVSEARNVVGKAAAGFRQATIEVLTNRETHQRTIEVQGPATKTGNSAEVARVTSALARMAHVPTSDVTINAVGPSWGSDITDKAIEAVIVFLLAVSIYIWLRFEAKMAVAALVALLHDMIVTAGIYSLSGFQVSPDTVIAFLTILGYSLYDTVIVFDKVQENTRGLASTNRLTYSDTVNLSMNQVLARSINTSLVTIIPILSILVIGAWALGATALDDFGLALLIGLTSGAYSSIFIASQVLALLKEREPRYAAIRRRLATTSTRRISPLAAAHGDFEGAPAGRPVRSSGAGAAALSQSRPGRSLAATGVQERPAGTQAGSLEEDRGLARAGEGAAPGAEDGYDLRAGSGGSAEADRLGRGSGDGGAGDGEAGSGTRRVGGSAEADRLARGAGGGDEGRQRPAVPPRSAKRPPPRPRKKGRRR